MNTESNMCYKESVTRYIPNLIIGKVYGFDSITKVNSMSPGKQYSWGREPAIYCGKRNHILYFKGLHNVSILSTRYVDTEFLRKLQSDDVLCECDLTTDEHYINCFNETEIPNETGSAFERKYYHTRYIQTFQIPVSDEEIKYNYSTNPCRVRSIYDYDAGKSMAVEYIKEHRFNTSIFDGYSSVNVVMINDSLRNEIFNASDVIVSDYNINAGSYCISIDDIVSGKVDICKNTIIINH